VTKRIPAVAALAAALSLAACGGGGSSRAQDTNVAVDTVVLKNLSFIPGTLTVKTGTTVTWKWQESVSHNVHGDTFKSDLQSKGTFEHTFDSAGEYPYKCDVHPTMKGVITVQ
jgi:plastocyanin